MGEENVRVSTLDNGVTVVSDHMPHLATTAVGIWVNTGSRAECEARHGISHLLEHMAFKGTKTRDALAIAEEIEAVGGELNAATGPETTAYFARVLKNDTGLAVDILSDILTNSVFDPVELEREQHVILQEIGAADDTPDDRVFDMFQEAAFSAQPLGRTILGTPESVTSFTPDDLRAFLAERYRGPEMVLSAAGAVDHDELCGWAEERLSGLSSDRAAPAEAAHYTGGTGIEKRDLMEAQIVSGFPGRSYRADDYYDTQILSSVLGGGMSSRLFQEVREKRGLCYSIHAFHWGFSDTGIFGVHAAASEEDLDELMPVIAGELARAAEDITDAEVDRAKAQIKAGLMMSLESPMARAGQIARQRLFFGKTISNDEICAKIDAVSKESVMTAARKIILSGQQTLAAIGPVGSLTPVEITRQAAE